MDAIALLTITAYVLVVTPSCAVTATVSVLLPTNSGMPVEAVPDATTVPFTFIVEAAPLIVGVIVMLVVALLTDVE